MRRLLAAHPINRGLSGWWAFLDGAAPIVDISPRARLAIGANSPTRTGSRVGRLGTLSSSSYYVAPDRPGDISRYSYAFWVRGTTTPANFAGVLVRTSTAGGSNITNSIQVYSNNLRVYHDQAIDPPVDTGITVASLLDGKVHCVGIAYDGATIYAYRDGLLVGSAAHSTQGTPKTGAGDLLIGIERGRTSGYAWNNQIGNIREWRRVLSADEFRRLNAYPWLGSAEPSRRRALKAGSGGTPFTADPGAGALTWAGQAASVQAGAALAAGAASLTWAGQQPVVAAGAALAAGAAALTWAGQQPVVAAGASLAAGPAALIWTGQGASVSAGAALAAGAAALTWAGQQAAVQAGANLAAGYATLAWQGHAASLAGSTVLQAGAGALAWQGQQAAVVAGALLLPGPAALVWQGLQPALVTTTQTLAAPAARTYTWRDRPRRAAWQTGPRAAAWLDRPRRVDWRDAEMPATVFQLRPQHVDDALDHAFVFTAFGTDDDVSSYTVTVPGAITQTASRSGQTVTVRIQGTAGTHRIVVHAVADSGQEATIEADIVISDPS